MATKNIGLHHQTRKCLKANLQCDDTELNKIHEILVDVNKFNDKFNDKTKNVASTIKCCLTPKDFENMCSKSRKFAEAVCTEYGIKSGNLCNDIKILQTQEETTPTHTLNFLRTTGNKAVHYNNEENDEKSPDNKTKIMRQIVSSISIVAEWFYIVMKKKQFDARLKHLSELDQQMNYNQRIISTNESQPKQTSRASDIKFGTPGKNKIADKINQQNNQAGNKRKSNKVDQNELERRVRNLLIKNPGELRFLSLLTTLRTMCRLKIQQHHLSKVLEKVAYRNKEKKYYLKNSHQKIK